MKRPPSALGLRLVLRFFAPVAVQFLPAIALAAPEAVPVVFTKPAQETALFDQLTYPARVESKVNAKIIAESDGVVQKIIVPLGGRVGRSSGILVIKNMDAGYQYAPMTIASPVAGVVSQIKVTVGSQVSKGQEIAAVTDPAQTKIIIEVSSLDLSALRAGMRGEFMITDQATALPLKLVGISPFVDPATGTATAELQIDGAAKNAARLAPGLVGQVRFKVNQRQGFSLPDYAVVYRGNETRVRLVREGKTLYVPVKLGRKRQGTVEILSGLKTGDEVIERASTFLAEGDAVQVQKDEPTKTKN